MPEAEDRPLFDLAELLLILLRWRRVIVSVVLVAAISAAVTVLLLPDTYRTEIIILPHIDEGGFLPFGEGGGAAALSAIAGSPRMDLPFMSTYADLYARILRSRYLAARVVKRLNLTERFDIETADDAIDELSDKVVTEVGLEGTVRVSAEEHDPQLAFDLAHAYVAELDTILREAETDRQKASLAFLEGQVELVERELREAEDSLSVFQSRHGAVSLDAQTEALVLQQASVESQLRSSRVELGMARQMYSPGHPVVSALELRLFELSRQLRRLETGPTGVGSFSEMPEVAAEYSRRLRDVELLSGTGQSLAVLAERARLESGRSTPLVQLLAPEGPPDCPKRKHILLMVWVVIVACVMITSTIAFTVEGYRRLQHEALLEATELSGEVRAFLRRPFSRS
jgi:hypothetical protein